MRQTKTTTLNDIKTRTRETALNNKQKGNYIMFIKKSQELNLQYVCVRTYSAGVHIGYLSERDGQEVELKNARRVWFWAGAASLSQLAEEGSSKQTECKISVTVSNILLLQAIEIISISAQAKKNLDAIQDWRA